MILLVHSFLIKKWKHNFPTIRTEYFWILFSVHFLLSCTYFIYAFLTRSDSVAYYNVAFNTDDWFSLFISGTHFIQFVSWPFINLLGLSYYAVMILFSFFGYLGVVYFYLSAKENIQLKPAWKGFSFIELIFLLPNLHFWSSSLGKGSVILFGISLFTYGLSRFNRRIITLSIGGIITYLVRPHILFALVLSTMIGLLVTRSGIKPFLKWTIVIVALLIFYYISEDVLKFANTDSLDITSSSTLMKRSAELSKSSSGINLHEYGFFMKIFTFWFRPLFIDGQGLLGFIVSFENILYIYMFYIIIKNLLFHWSKWNGWFKICIFIFILTSYILSQVTGNLGIALRQKAQIIPFFYIVFCKAIYYKQNIK